MEAWQQLMMQQQVDMKNELYRIEKKLDKISDDVVTLKVKSGVWGLTGGAGGAGLIGLLIKLFS